MKAIMKNGQEIYLNEVSKYGSQKGRLDYASMVRWCTGGAMVFLTVSPWKLSEDWEKENEQDEEDSEAYEEDDEAYEEDDEAYEEDDDEVFQWFIIDGESARFFVEFTNELIYYSYALDMYLLGVTHCGTAWNYVLTEWKVEEE